MALAFLCCITKEVAAPFVLMVYVAARGTAAGSTVAIRWKDLLHGAPPVIAGIVAGVIVNLVFNQFRFGELGNVSNLHPNFRSPPSAVAAYFAYLFIAPAGGLLYVWFSLVALLGAALVASRKRDEDLILLGWAIIVVVGREHRACLLVVVVRLERMGPAPHPAIPRGRGAARALGRNRPAGDPQAASRGRRGAGLRGALRLHASQRADTAGTGSLLRADVRAGHARPAAGPERDGVRDGRTGALQIRLAGVVRTPHRGMSVTVRLAAERPLIVATVALYAALAAWRIVRAGAQPRG
jgi:hypothetical protein